MGRAVLWLHPPFPQVPKEMASAWCKEKDIPYFEVSAKNNINVAEAFETLAKQALNTVSIAPAPSLCPQRGVRVGAGLSRCPELIRQTLRAHLQRQNIVCLYRDPGRETHQCLIL